MATTVVLVGVPDRGVEERLRSLGMRARSVPASDLATLAHPSSTPPEVVVIDLRGQHQIPQAVGLIKRQHPDAALIIIASTLDPALMLEAMRAGVSECLTDVAGGELEAAVTRLLAQRAAPVEGEVFAIVGAKGGVGATTIAVNVATLISKMGSTLLIDLHLAGSDASLYLGASSSFSVIDAIENTHRMDVAYFRGLVSNTAAGPDLLASADRTAAPPADPDRLRALIDFAAHHYRYTVLDVPRADAAALDALSGVSTIVVVTNQELAGVRSAGRLATTLRQQYGKERVTVVVSRPDRQAEIEMEDLQRAVGGRVRHVFPSEYRVAVTALNRGRPIVLDNKTPLAMMYQTFTRDLAGVKTTTKTAAQAPATGFLGRLTGRRI